MSTLSRLIAAATLVLTEALGALGVPPRYQRSPYPGRLQTHQSQNGLSPRPWPQRRTALHDDADKDPPRDVR